ncbi:MAG: hypothetical protein NUV96_00595 [Candidatus Colwellbacteria bacterium]|nr:hypothetical protein [Candidatus Colwellbacteria bacterium]
MTVTGGREDIRRALVACIDAIEKDGEGNVEIPVEAKAVQALGEVFGEHGLVTHPHPVVGRLSMVEVWRKPLSIIEGMFLSED